MLDANSGIFPSFWAFFIKGVCGTLEGRVGAPRDPAERRWAGLSTSRCRIPAAGAAAQHTGVLTAAYLPSLLLHWRPGWPPVLREGPVSPFGCREVGTGLDSELAG